MSSVFLCAMAVDEAQLKHFQELTECHTRLVELDKALKGSSLAPSVDKLLGRTKKAATANPKAKAGRMKNPKGGGVGKPAKKAKTKTVEKA